MSHETVRKVFRDDLNLRNVSQHIVPRVMTEDQKEEKIRIFKEWLQADESDDTFSRVIAGYDSSQLDFRIWPRQNIILYGLVGASWVTCKKSMAMQVTSDGEDRSFLLLTWIGIYSWIKLAQGEAITGQIYVETTRRLRKATCWPKNQPKYSNTQPTGWYCSMGLLPVRYVERFNRGNYISGHKGDEIRRSAPISRDSRKWVEKCFPSWKKGCISVLLRRKKITFEGDKIYMS